MGRRNLSLLVNLSFSVHQRVFYIGTAYIDRQNPFVHQLPPCFRISVNRTRFFYIILRLRSSAEYSA